MAVCEICDKKSVVGSSQKHRRGVAGKRWKKKVPATARLFRANIQSATIEVKGKKKKVKICTSCLKRYKKNRKEKSLSI